MEKHVTDSKTAKVDGLLKKNIEIRNRMLKMNNGTYSQWIDYNSPKIGEVYNMRTFTNHIPVNLGKDLLSYTYDGTTPYSRYLLTKYLITPYTSELYFVKNFNVLRNRYSFSNDYDGTYLDYFNSVYNNVNGSSKYDAGGHISNIFSSLINGNTVSFKLNDENFSVGYVPDAAFTIGSGENETNDGRIRIYTNPNVSSGEYERISVDDYLSSHKYSWQSLRNDMSGTDTVLGVVSNRILFDRTLSERKRIEDRQKAKDENGTRKWLNGISVDPKYYRYRKVSSLENTFDMVSRNGEEADYSYDDLISRKGSIRSFDFSTIGNFSTNTKYTGRLESDDDTDIDTKDRENPFVTFTIDNHFLEEQIDKSKRDNPHQYYKDDKSDDGYSFSFGDGTDTYSTINNGRSLIEREIYHETDGQTDIPQGNMTLNNLSDTPGEDFYTYKNVDNGSNKDNTQSLLQKTYAMFRSHKINTMVGRFHQSDSLKNGGFLGTGYNNTFGYSHGRNLLSLNKNRKTNAYENPYCRVWTWHYQYDRYSRAIRDFSKWDGYYDINGKGEEKFKWGKLFDQNRNWSIKETSKGTVLNTLRFHSVLKDGRLHIAPYRHELQTMRNLGNLLPMTSYELKNYMFSIENLAWKDFASQMKDGAEKYGPNGGRIMWFPPYGLNFSESVSVDWKSNSFIGRGENVYTYANTNRTGTVEFVLLVDHPSVVENMSFGSKHSYMLRKADTNTYQNVGSDTLKDYKEFRANERNYDRSMLPEGGGNDDDDQAILRFFAGCEEEGIYVFNKKDYRKQTSEKYQAPKSTLEYLTDDDPNKVRFAVFFPNNYSGNLKYEDVFKKDPTPEEIRTYVKETNGYLDEDCFEYLTNGRNTKIDNNGYGYEMFGHSITDTDKKYANEFIAACGKDSERQMADFHICTDPNDNPDKHFYYRVDYDLKQNMLSIEEKGSKRTNYRDRCSFGLNFDLKRALNKKSDKDINSHDKAYFEGCNYSFSDIYDALTDKQDVERNGESLIDKLKRTKHIHVFGCATEQDSDNSNELANRRASTVGNLLIKEFKNFGVDLKKNTDLSIGNRGDVKFDQDIVRFTTKVKMPDGGLTEGDNSSFTAKFKRCVIVTLELDQPSITTSGNEAPDTVTEEPVVLEEVNETTNYYSAYEYFERLENNDPVVFKRITDKFKYFDPAFHSISPEGFNARLTFLHQCTRQGHTQSASEINGKVAPTAGNLAFGRMPVCVLRLGDFINTRCIINNMSINYSNDGMQWDLNPEGIGVQPIFARVSLTVTLIGGSVLTEPINRLQNAQTFNYYANTGMYDERADYVEKIGDDKNKKYHVYNPLVNNDVKTE